MVIGFFVLCSFVIVAGTSFLFCFVLTNRSMNGCFKVGVNRLIELRARTLFFPWPSFLTISEPMHARTSPLPAGAPNHLPNSLNGNKLARSPNDRPTIEGAEK